MADQSENLVVRTFDQPDENLDVDHAGAQRVTVGSASVWKFTFEPGWRYTRHMDEELCPEPHAAYIAAGRLRVLMEDGTQAEAGPGSVMAIQPGHDAWTVGEEPCVFIDFGQRVRFDSSGALRRPQ